jgi:hypothetical protein
LHLLSRKCPSRLLVASSLLDWPLEDTKANILIYDFESQPICSKHWHWH